jgi:transposase InsO family protein
VQRILTLVTWLTRLCLRSLHHRFVAWTTPDATSLLLGMLKDLSRSKSHLVAENALLRKPLIILRRQVKRPACTKTDRILLVLLARMVRTWKQALFIIQPETLLRWHRQGFRLFWKYKSGVVASRPKIAAETIALIKEMARDNRLWGAERIRGELLKLGIHVCKRTIQKYMRHARSPRQRGQNWATFLRNHAKDMWACDFLQVTDLFFRSLFAFFNTLLHSRRVIHVGVTRSPTDAWTAQQLREATPYGQSPKYLIRDRDSKYGSCFARVAATSGIKILKTPYHAKRPNAICERFLLSVRRECLDHLFILQEKQLHRVLGAYVQYFNQVRPHQGITQHIPEHYGEPVPLDHKRGKILSLPVLGGLHRDYRRSA